MKSTIVSIFILLSSLSKCYGLNENLLIKLDTNFIINPKNEVDSIKFVIQHYYSAPTLPEKLEYVFNSNKIKDEVEKYYSDEYKSEQIIKETISITKTKIQKGEYIKVPIKIGQFKKALVVIKRCDDNSFKVDWEATVGYNKQSLTAYILSGDTVPRQFRFDIELASLFRDDLMYNKKSVSNTDFISVRIYTNPQSPFGWVIKDSPTGKSIFNLLQDGKMHKVIVMIKPVDFKDNTGKINKQGCDIGDKNIIITQLISEDWIIK